jgi:UDP-3-O-[3-hydroxymyristoyl] glucosamine N-acyltransferase
VKALTVAELAGICGGVAEGDLARTISGAAALEVAGETDLSFAASQKASASAASSRAGCLLVSDSFDVPGPWALIRVAEPRRAFAKVLGVIYAAEPPPHLRHPSAVIAASAQVHAACSIGAHVYVGENSRIAEGCVIGNGCVIGSNVSLGAGTTLHPNVTLYDAVRVGSRVILHAGCVIGADGFGFALAGDRYEKFPQVGTVEIGDDVEIGANSCVDRAALGVTCIGDGTKFDNLVHVAHNCNIGRHVVVAAQTGFSGSVSVGDYAVIGGQVGIGENAKIAARAIVGGKSGVLTSQSIPAGEPVWGIPARPLRQHLKGLANVQRLPELKEQLLQLKQRVAELERLQGALER